MIPGQRAPVRRIASLDIVRGAVMVLMAIDHVRVYSGQPAGGPTVGIFFTRWVTHFCAPAFVFLAGIGAFLQGRRLGDTAGLARYLVTRGLLLVALELTVIRASWTFNVDYANFTLAGVIWMLGWCMVLMAGLVRFSTKTIGIVGLVLMVFQQLFFLLPRVLPAKLGPIWEFIYPADADAAFGIHVLYVIVPWIGVMAAGYWFGSVMLREPADRRRCCLRIGLWATGLYLVYAAVFLILGPSDEGPKVFAALNPAKYPASQPFLLMTLGPTILLLPFIENLRGFLADGLRTFGRVPLFYYLLHIPLIHVSALIVTRVREGAMHPEWYATAPFTSVPEGHMWPLALLYLVWAIDVALLYVACRWFAGVKASRPGGLLRFL